MMAVHSLGTLTFVNFERTDVSGGAPPVWKEKVEMVQRAGVAGSGFLLHNKKGDPFSKRSIVDVLNQSNAHDLENIYHDLVGNTENILWNGVDYESTHDVKFFVMNVSNIRIKRVGKISGGLNGSSGTYIVEAIWELVAIQGI